MMLQGDARVNDETQMALALIEARVAALRGEVPVGCVLVDAGGEVVARGHNLRELLDDPTAHAEVVAMRKAAFDRRTWRLDGLTAYVTLEPCAMCAGAFTNARITRVVYGCDDPRAGALRSLYQLGGDVRLNHRYEVSAGVCAEACAELLRAFFRERREAKRRER
jgi:tRNA(adenine34) deaminase